MNASETPIRVLVVDDDLFVQEAARVLIENSPDLTVVGTCGDGRESVQLALEAVPHIVLMDVSLPTLDGVEASRQILAADRGIRVLIWTSFENAAAVRAALALGASGFLMKNCGAAALLNSLRAAASGVRVMGPEAFDTVVGQRGLGAPPPALSDRERSVLTLLCEGVSNAEIASALYLSESSVKMHVRALMRKFDARTRVQVVVRALEADLP